MKAGRGAFSHLVAYFSLAFLFHFLPFSHIAPRILAPPFRPPRPFYDLLMSFSSPPSLFSGRFICHILPSPAR